MLAFLSASENIAFTTAIVLMLLIGVVQLIGVDGDADLDIDAHGPLDWLGVGRLPLLMLVVVFLSLFGLIGLVGQQLSHDLTGALVTPWLAVPAATIAALPLTGLAARGLARILPRDFTTAVPVDVLVGRSARIVTGRAFRGHPARARAEDQHGQTHYVMVEPDNDDSFEEGETVLIVRREAELFRAISRGDRRLPDLTNL